MSDQPCACSSRAGKNRFVREGLIKIKRQKEKGKRKKAKGKSKDPRSFTRSGLLPFYFLVFTSLSAPFARHPVSRHREDRVADIYSRRGVLHQQSGLG